ncbi:DedA family protein [Alginatibacterium sediminis]|uniref:DedA family protein n=1 Tax=Alginatibacterium sediminis TaxID=2164068 RepID=A0A420EFP3_9ALTE|nr:VTT domain-containing protein [Alginatibacterium sediminis]RKF19531.1 DedA family protein [Alginatibacterium sediminis]
MQSLNDLLVQYGLLVYFILFAYCALKSGWLPLFAGYAAYTGVLDLQYVALSVFLGAYLGDELRFALAKAYGTTWVERSPRLKGLFETARNLSQQYANAYIFIYRYPKGLRTIGALPLGLTDIGWKKFTLMNMSSAALWVSILVGGGYFFGEQVNSFGIANLTALSVMLLCVFLIGLFSLLKSARVASHV